MAEERRDSCGVYIMDFSFPSCVVERAWHNVQMSMVKYKQRSMTTE